jgi:hypothetical protein
MSISIPAANVDLLGNYDNLNNSLQLMQTKGQYRRYNFGGYVTYSKNEQSVDDAPSYTQIFRNGSIEAIWTFHLYSIDQKRRLRA